MIHILISIICIIFVAADTPIETEITQNLRGGKREIKHDHSIALTFCSLIPIINILMIINKLIKITFDK